MPSTREIIALISIRHPNCRHTPALSSLPELQSFTRPSDEEIRAILDGGDSVRVGRIRNWIRASRGNVLLEHMLENITHAEMVFPLLWDLGFKVVTVWLTPNINEPPSDDLDTLRKVKHFVAHTEPAMAVFARLGQMVTLKDGNDVFSHILEYLPKQLQESVSASRQRLVA